MGGESGISVQEVEQDHRYSRLPCAGKPDKTWSTIGIAPHTVEWHVRHVIEKLQVHTMLQAVIAAVRRGVIDLGSAP